MPPRPSLRSFLSLARGKLSASPSQRELPLTFVVGNESADLDSLCSAVIFAYLRTTANAQAQKVHIPISNLSRDDLRLRSEMTAVLAYVGLKPQDLLTLDDLPNGEAAPGSGDTTWYLVDHNSPTGIIKERYGGRIAGCIDHHADENYVPEDGNPRVIETCGSCVSLIVECCRDAWDSLASEARESKDAAEADRGMALMALGVIFSDTVNLKAKEKVTPRDVDAVEYLEKKLGGTDYDREKYCDEIEKVRRDLDGLSFRDIFRKDYKEWVENGLKLGTCSVIQNIEYLLARAGSGDVLMKELGRWAEEKSLDLVSIMTLATHDDGKYERQVLLWGLNEKAAKASREFERVSGDELELQAFEGGSLDLDAHGQWRKAWKQGNLKHSRKQIAPMIRDAMNGVGS
ncbi:hypothetical protein jhhlp_003752 [Lomentospora prolificans]|uniref:DHHA2 domain-containing protein n=1 Tax=Lomentospora prolificans TaxID=41688 RepID=A0A2N3N9L6_9PEZI|nr:hypothetical protein jhhlp_003752 [Lomentospora prolificans]